MTLDDVKTQVVGIEQKVPLLDGSHRQYIYLDNAASTPTLLQIQQKVDEFSEWYSNVHRGTGFKSQLSSWVFEEARSIIADFVKADATASVIFCKNTTEAINKLAGRFQCPGAGEERPVILTSIMEHHSNELPWRKVGRVIHVDLKPDGTVNEQDLYKKLDKHTGHVQIVAITGASNVTGYVNPVHEFARKAHKAGAQIVVDAAQLGAHRPIDVKRADDPEHIDYLAFSAHKMYAPYGIGVLVTQKNIFEVGSPEYVGGGTVDIVSLESAYWKDLPEREEAGTPDIVGVVALAKAIKVLQEIGFDAIIDHEAELTAYALKRLVGIPEVVIYGDADAKRARDRLGVIAFNVRGMSHALVAAILSYEGGIGARNGCFCAHPYVKQLLGVDEEESREVEAQIIARDRSRLPGMVRISFGLYNTEEEIDHLVDVLQMIVKKQYKGEYMLDKERGEYHPKGFSYDFPKYFTL
ncbi:MAG: aminotransferase class V-fold PLP-dependent enzyme [candidate division WOR-3 bacterium]|nr:MAG: aminotransferase class V-fold PLP-dependent enzyme [candidate division WOR-3 bacterium]